MSFVVTFSMAGAAYIVADNYLKNPYIIVHHFSLSEKHYIQ